ncbi:hypothetical protein [Anaerosporobacter sp.]|uniref:hypothetical protein n=1 Tax=Anaerosporobacter sp. TaxID=1872529 RepID=UPI00286F6DB5|nr:hypothetical protein [Anaerosporobacter sp.]
MYEILEKACAIMCVVFGVLMLFLPLDTLKKMKIVKEHVSATKTKVLGGLITVLGIVALILFFSI